MVRAVLDNYCTAPIPDREKLLFAFLAKVNAAPVKVAPEDVAQLEQASWSDEAIFDAITVCALFNFFNRWVDGHGIPALSEAAHRAGGRRMASQGYISQ